LDYKICFGLLITSLFFAVNVSSPNTPNLRALQDKEPLTQLLQTIQNEEQQSQNKPILLKIT
jgi:dihydroorotate dehydrogenase